MLTLATFNLKDLFVPTTSEPAWQLAWQTKLADVAGRIRLAEADVVGLQEVGGAAALEALLTELGAGWSGLAGTPDERGIGCAVVTRLQAARFAQHRTDALPFPAFVEGERSPFEGQLVLRRAVVELAAEVSGHTLHVFVVHMKSNLPRPLRSAAGQEIAPRTAFERSEGHVRSMVLRAAEALFVRKLVDDALQGSPQVAVLGDFNDTPGSLPLRTVQGRDPSYLSSVLERLPEHKRYTTLFHGRTKLIDHIVASPALHARLHSADIDLRGLRDHGPFVAESVPTRDSDHAMLFARYSL